MTKQPPKLLNSQVSQFTLENECQFPFFSKLKATEISILALLPIFEAKLNFLFLLSKQGLTVISISVLVQILLFSVQTPTKSFFFL